MLVLTRKSGQSIMIGDQIIVKIIETKGDLVKIGIEAPREISVHRHEVYEDIKRENIQAAKVDESLLPELFKLL